MVFDLRGPTGTPTGDAARFIAALNTARHIFSGIETNAGIVRLTFDDGQVGEASDYEDVPIGLFNCLTYYFEVPHTGWLHAVAHVYATEPPFELEVAYEGMDGPLMVRFSDGSILTSEIRPMPSTQPPENWESAVNEGAAQREIEAVVTLAILSGLTEALDGRDSDLAEAVIALLSQLATTPEPPKGLVLEAARWLGRKVDIFLEEAAKTSGKIVGGALVGVAAFQLSKYLPELSEQLARLIDLAD